MPLSEHVWTGENLNVLIYIENEDGSLGNGGNPVLDYCFFTRAEVTSEVELTRRPVTGRAVRKITARAYEYQMNVAHLYFKKSTEFDTAQIFNREQALQVVMQFASLEGRIEEHRLKRAFAQGYGISVVDAGLSEGSARFWAEQYE